MVEKELQQHQVVGAELSAQEEVVTQSAVEVLDDRTGADDVLGQVAHGFLEGVEAVAELLAQRRFFWPTSRLAFVQGQQVEQFADDGHGDLELGGQVGQVLVELGGEGQELVVVVFQERAQGIEAMGTKRCPRLQFGEDEIGQSATVGVGESGDRKDVVVQPTYQQGDIVCQSDRLDLGLVCQRGFAAQRLVRSSLFSPLGSLVLELVMGRDGMVSTVFQVGDDGCGLVQGMKDITAARGAGHGQFLAGAEGGAEVGD